MKNKKPGAEPGASILSAAALGIYAGALAIWLFAAYWLITPMRADYYTRLGKELLELKHFQHASRAFEIAEQLDPAAIEAIFRHGISSSGEYSNSPTMPMPERKELLLTSMREFLLTDKLRTDTVIYDSLATTAGIMGNAEDTVYYRNMSFYFGGSIDRARALGQIEQFMLPTADVMIRNGKYRQAALVYRNAFYGQPGPAGEITSALWRAIYLKPGGDNIGRGETVWLMAGILADKSSGQISSARDTFQSAGAFELAKMLDETGLIGGEQNK